MALTEITRPLFSADIVQIRRTQTPEEIRLGIAPEPAYPSARPIKATVSETAKLMLHPLENGAMVADHRVVLPIGITMIVIIDPKLFTFRPISGEFGLFQTYRNVYESIQTDFTNSVSFTVQTKSGIYKNMYLQGIPHEEDPSQFDTITIILEFIEAQFASVQIQENTTDNTRDPNDTSTINSGDQTTTTQPPSSFGFRLLGLGG